MSEPTLISPLLDGFTMGQPMGEHDGVSCCPAIKEDTDKKYIVKIITIPATQTQMDALLLAGAYKDPADAMEYFRQVGEDVLKEAELLKQLSQLEGFLSYEGWQMVPITRKRLGYQVYLVGTYKRTLEKHLRKSPVTHLEAINLGLDLCAALSVCRQARFETCQYFCVGEEAVPDRRPGLYPSGRIELYFPAKKISEPLHPAGAV